MKKCFSFLGVIFTFLLMIDPRADALELDLGRFTIPPVAELPERFWPLPPVTEDSEEEEEDSGEMVTLPESVRRRLEEELRPRIPGIRDGLIDPLPLPPDGDGVPDPIEPEPGVPPPELPAPPTPPSDPTVPEGSRGPTTGPATGPVPGPAPATSGEGDTNPVLLAEGGCSLSVMTSTPSAAIFWMLGIGIGGTMAWRRRKS